MNDGQAAQLIGTALMLVLVGSSLLARRLPLGQAARMAAGWVLIFAALLVGYSYREELSAVAQRVGGDVLGERGQTIGGSLRVPMAPDGHFWVRARVNGTSVRFLIDSGATTTALSSDTARDAGVAVNSGGFPVLINTANGPVEARRARVERLSVGPIVATDLAVVVAPAFGDTNVLGMNFLSSLRSWRVEGQSLVLEPKQPARSSGT
ncbi:TIGR02281 family clan AA aspartic protease [Sphingomonas sp. ID1715]|uniref:retropepsin-like aspartic protease family protein n=1 Tax=Sphingomonas sp. ID1715 TaxID=1656898 RepID=UPI001488DB75|nr:TIGR02281 family clan AA aspartic protease [Sphingomonas sp. ID1715]NNM75413.1 TIGR02281 family clan AA aspartic protease [Sphingomonas sp. ID1715]